MTHPQRAGERSLLSKLDDALLVVVVLVVVFAVLQVIGWIIGTAMLLLKLAVLALLALGLFRWLGRR